MLTKVMNLVERYGEFDLVALPISTFQKKNGCVTVTEGGIVEKFVEVYPELPKRMGEVVETFGGCPHDVVADVKNGKTVKLFSFPITPVTIIAQEPDNIVQSQFIGQFKKGKLLPGFLCKPRLDMVEYSCFKLGQIIKWYKLKNVAIPIDAFGLTPKDGDDIKALREMMDEYLDKDVFLIMPPKNAAKPVVNMVESSVSYEDEDEISDNFKDIVEF